MQDINSNNEYKIVEGLNYYDLVAGVRSSIDEGWEPSGGVSSVNTDSHQGVLFYQAMTKRSIVSTDLQKPILEKPNSEPIKKDRHWKFIEPNTGIPAGSKIILWSMDRLDLYTVPLMVDSWISELQKLTKTPHYWLWYDVTDNLYHDLVYGHWIPEKDLSIYNLPKNLPIIVKSNIVVGRVDSTDVLGDLALYANDINAWTPELYNRFDNLAYESQSWNLYQGVSNMVKNMFGDTLVKEGNMIHLLKKGDSYDYVDSEHDLYYMDVGVGFEMGSLVSRNIVKEPVEFIK